MRDTFAECPCQRADRDADDANQEAARLRLAQIRRVESCGVASMPAMSDGLAALVDAAVTLARQPGFIVVAPRAGCAHAASTLSMAWAHRLATDGLDAKWVRADNESLRLATVDELRAARESPVLAMVGLGAHDPAPWVVSRAAGLVEAREGLLTLVVVALPFADMVKQLGENVGALLKAGWPERIIEVAHER